MKAKIAVAVLLVAVLLYAALWARGAWACQRNGAPADRVRLLWVFVDYDPEPGYPWVVAECR